MNAITSSFLICAALLLAACGGSDSAVSNSPVINPPTNNPPAGNPGPGDEGSDPPEPPPTQNDGPYVIDYYGDSTVWGWVAGSSGARIETPAPEAFAAALPASPENVVRNEGVNGSTACDLLNGTDGVHPQWRAQMELSDATHVILNHGINDRKSYDIGQYRSCLRELVRIAREQGKAVVLETPNPITSEGLDTYVQAMHDVALAQDPDVPVIDQHAYLIERLGDASVDSIIPDGEHPDQATYILKGQYAARRFMEFYPR